MTIGRTGQQFLTTKDTKILKNYFLVGQKVGPRKLNFDFLVPFLSSRLFGERNEQERKSKNKQYYMLKTNPIYDNVRSDLLFQELLEKQKKLYEENMAKYGDIDI